MEYIRKNLFQDFKFVKLQINKNKMLVQFMFPLFEYLYTMLFFIQLFTNLYN